MTLRFFDALVNLTASVPVAGLLVIVLLGLATDAAEAFMRQPLRRRTRDVLLS
jgi:hypothetical protein